ncbi:MAG: TAXI family TRAP transporter solute-binding subunit [Candidatus Rokubacteria bacterium]|nr:TAXI family TRAP transporter solute-binding subunit [Candidatus Rokubacteria bacterium]
MRRIAAAFFVAMVGAMLGAPAALGAEPAEVTIASLSPGTAWYVYGAAIAEVLKKHLPPGSKVEVLPQAGGVGNAKLIGQGKANFGFSFALTNQWAFQGKHAYDRKLDMLRGVAGGMDTYYLAVLVRADAGIPSLADLKEKRGKIALGTLPVGTAGEYGTRNLLEVLGITYDEIRKAGGSVAHTGYPTMVTAMKDGRMNTIMAVITPAHPSITEIALQNEVRFLPLPPDIVAKMREKLNYEPQTMPAGMFRGMDRDVATVGYPTVFITRRDVPETLVYTVTKAIADNKEALVAAHKGLAKFDPAAAWKPELVGLPLHPGAERYYREKGWMK